MGPENSEGLVYPRASQGKRLLNYLLDLTFAGLLVIALVTAIGMLAPPAPGNVAFGQAEESSPLEIFAFYFGLLAYYLGSEHCYGRTLGKMITRTKVLALDNKRASFLQILGRCFCQLIPFNAFSFLGVTACGWHDTIPKTKVVDTSETPVNPRNSPNAPK